VNADARTTAEKARWCIAKPRRTTSADGTTGTTRVTITGTNPLRMGKMKQVYMQFLEERKYERTLTEEEWLRRVAYTKNQQPKKDVKAASTPNGKQ
jgi:hypothetical protein